MKMMINSNSRQCKLPHKNHSDDDDGRSENRVKVRHKILKKETKDKVITKQLTIGGVDDW